jgi:polar amino acid transport system permease protein
MTVISLLEIAFFVFWLWTLMDLINQEGIEDTRKARLITFHTFLGFIGIAFYFFMLISAFASEEVLGLTIKSVVKINRETFLMISKRLQPALFIAFLIILLVPVVAAFNLIYKGNLRAKRFLKTINLIECLYIFAIFIYILIVASHLEKINDVSPYLYRSKDVIYSQAQIFGMSFGFDTISFTFNAVLYLFAATIIVWLFTALHYIIIVKIPIISKSEVILNTDEITNLASMAKLYKNATYFLLGFAVILLRNFWDLLTGFKIKPLFIRLSETVSGLNISILSKLNEGIIDKLHHSTRRGDTLIEIVERITKYKYAGYGNLRLNKNVYDSERFRDVFQPWYDSEIISQIIALGKDGSWFKLKLGLGLYDFFNSFFEGSLGGVFSPSFVIAYMLIIFALVTWLLLSNINRDLDEMQETHEVKMGGFKHAIYTNFFNAWKVSLFAALTTILMLLYFKTDPYLDILDFIKSGIIVTFEVTVGAMIFSLMLGLTAGLGKLSKNVFIKGIASIYIEVIRGIPLLVQIFYIHFGLGHFVKFPPLVSAILAMSICYGAYMGETIRAGIQSISHGQMEAAKSLGMTNFQTMRQVIVPQGIKVILPPIGNEFIALLKDSSLVSIIAVADILRKAREYVAMHFTPFEAYTLVALIYLVITLVLSKVVWNMEKYLAIDD